MAKDALEKRILCVAGSPRTHGNSDTIMKTFLGALPNTIPSDAVLLRNYEYKPCIGCERCRKDKLCTGINDGMQLLYSKVIQSQGLVLISPTHHYNITAWMKAFIDRLYCFYDFENTIPRAWSSRLAGQNRKASIFAVCEQENKKDMGFTLEAMAYPLEALGYEIVSQVPVFRIFDRGKVKNDLQAMADITQAAGKMADALHKS